MNCRLCKLKIPKDSPLGRIPIGVYALCAVSFLGSITLIDCLHGFNWNLVTAVSFLLAGLCLISFAAGFDLLWRYRKRYWKCVEGVVIGQVHDRDCCFAKISYRIADKNTEFVSRYDDVEVEVGRKSDVYYCPCCFVAEEYPQSGRLYFSVFAGAIGLMLMGMGVVALLEGTVFG